MCFGGPKFFDTHCILSSVTRRESYKNPNTQDLRKWSSKLKKKLFDKIGIKVLMVLVAYLEIE